MTKEEKYLQDLIGRTENLKSVSMEKIIPELKRKQAIKMWISSLQNLKKKAVEYKKNI